MKYLGKLIINDHNHRRTWHVWGDVESDIFGIRYGISEDIFTASKLMFESDIESELERLLWEFAELSIQDLSPATTELIDHKDDLRRWLQ